MDHPSHYARARARIPEKKEPISLCEGELKKGYPSHYAKASTAEKDHPSHELQSRGQSQDSRKKSNPSHEMCRWALSSAVRGGVPVGQAEPHCALCSAPESGSHYPRVSVSGEDSGKYV